MVRPAASFLALSVAGLFAGVNGIERVAWLAGCWEMQRGTTTIQEQWMAPMGGVRLGMSRTVRRDSLAEFETVLLRARGDTLAYEAHPSGQPAAVFIATEVSDSHVVFSNPAHDFPQRVIYRRRADSLLARVEGTRNGQLRGFDFPYRRAECAGGARGG